MEKKSIVESYGEPLLRLSATDAVYSVPSSFFLETTKRWAFNRPSDENRAELIAARIKEMGVVEGMIMLALTVDEDGEERLLCYDGNHRRFALRKLLEKDPETEYTVVVCIATDLSTFSITNRYKAINKAVPVPFIYRKSFASKNKRKEIALDVARRIKEEWPTCCKPSNHPCKPHFNEGNLSDMIYKFLDDNDIEMTTDKLFECILDLNVKYSEEIDLSRNTARISKKVKETGCYLFLRANFTEDMTL